MPGRSRALTFAGLAGAAACMIAWRRRQLTWGAVPEEVARPLPGDDLVPSPTFNATRAISINAASERVWPSLVQVGAGRAGWYSYDLLDNLGRPSATRIKYEWQHLTPGDVVPMSPAGRHGIKVHSLDFPQSMVWGTPGDTSWAWQLDARADGGTRHLTRIRSRIKGTPLPSYSCGVDTGRVGQFLDAYDTFSRAADTNALKVVISR